jgi:hypothetical protein
MFFTLLPKNQGELALRSVAGDGRTQGSRRLCAGKLDGQINGSIDSGSGIRRLRKYRRRGPIICSSLAQDSKGRDVVVGK